MDQLTRQIIVRLQDNPRSLSRNRNFSTFEQPAARRARRVARYLRSLAADILGERGPGQVQVQRVRQGQRCMIQLRFPALASSRTAYLSPDEFELLLARPGLRDALALSGVA